MRRCPTCGQDAPEPTTASGRVRQKWRVGEFAENAAIVSQVVDIAETLERAGAEALEMVAAIDPSDLHADDRERLRSAADVLTAALPVNA